MNMDAKNMDDMIARFKTLEAEFDRMARMVKDASDAFDEYQAKVELLESQSRLFRSMYWKLKDDMKPIVAGLIDRPPVAPKKS